MHEAERRRLHSHHTQLVIVCLRALRAAVPSLQDHIDSIRADYRANWGSSDKQVSGPSAVRCTTHRLPLEVFLLQALHDARPPEQRFWRVQTQQMGVALYFIDKLALRAGHEKDEDEADTVGCCTLKVRGACLAC